MCGQGVRAAPRRARGLGEGACQVQAARHGSAHGRCTPLTLTPAHHHRAGRRQRQSGHAEAACRRLCFQAGRPCEFLLRGEAGPCTDELLHARRLLSAHQDLRARGHIWRLRCTEHWGGERGRTPQHGHRLRRRHHTLRDSAPPPAPAHARGRERTVLIHKPAVPAQAPLPVSVRDDRQGAPARRGGLHDEQAVCGCSHGGL
mmetsp:Transcript_9554/g.28287  ORF Transcript_9554/g.28287 Transcript_9554/m.28287 type:complete len:202 (+) Transcript_9554:917-1522(+)